MKGRAGGGRHGLVSTVSMRHLAETTKSYLQHLQPENKVDMKCHVKSIEIWGFCDGMRRFVPVRHGGGEGVGSCLCDTLGSGVVWDRVGTREGKMTIPHSLN